MSSQDMSTKEKLVFIASFMWALHWGVRVIYSVFSTLELRYF